MTLEHINITTILALLAWPIVALWLYRTRPIGRATLWTILGGYLLLPVGASFKFDMIPLFDKYSISNLVAFFACMLLARRPVRISNGFGLVELLILTFLISPFITALLNGDPIVSGPLILPGVGIYDGASSIIGQFISLMPFFLGRHFLRNATDTEDILRVLTVAGLAYSLPMLFEVRMSPQLHTWIYGYFPGVFVQQMRQGGFRPVVFLGHGLLVGLLTMTAAVAAAALWRTQTRISRFPPAGVTAYLGVVLILSKNFGSFLYGAVLVPLVRWATPRMQLRLATLMVVIALAYPMLRTMDLVPTTFMLEAVESIDTDRAGSLGKRFEQEHLLLGRASQRLWFGWGRFGRNLIYNQYGSLASEPDGYWVITMGVFGLIGFLAVFGLLSLSVLRAASALRSAESMRDGVFLAALALIVAINIIDLLPNATLVPWTWLLAGALLGRAEALRAVG
jgi:hypothetical protein